MRERENDVKRNAERDGARDRQRDAQRDMLRSSPPHLRSAADQHMAKQLFDFDGLVIWDDELAASLALTMTVLGNAWSQRQQFYPSVVYITKSNPSMAVIYLQVDLHTDDVLKMILCCLQSLVLVILMGKLMRKVFFGQLRAAEFEHLMERSWYAVTETCLAFTVFK